MFPNTSLIIRYRAHTLCNFLYNTNILMPYKAEVEK